MPVNPPVRSYLIRWTSIPASYPVLAGAAPTARSSDPRQPSLGGGGGVVPPTVIPTSAQPFFTACCSRLPDPYRSAAAWYVKSAQFWKFELEESLSFRV